MPSQVREARFVWRHHEEWYAMHARVPGATVHRDPDITWMAQGGRVWLNGGVAVRFREGTVVPRLTQVLARFKERGVGFWIDPEATPADVEAHLKRHRFRCRKYFPGMYCDLHALKDVLLPQGVTILPVIDHGMYEEMPHPYFGRISTPIRRYELARLVSLATRIPRDVFDFVAVERGQPIGACTLALSGSAAGLHDVGVVADRRGRGVGSALVLHALRFARAQHYQHAVLIATGIGFQMYQRIGFREVCRIGYWYRA
jgi:GNAT superfamily N-acetyltransferase